VGLPWPSVVANVSQPAESRRAVAFLSPALDALFLCGGFSIPLVVLGASIVAPWQVDPASRFVVFALANYAHFASSTVRFYTKPGTRSAHPFVAWGLPLLFGVAIVLGIYAPDAVGRNITALYLSWSPYHYAAQAYGLSLLYCHRSGIALSGREKTGLWWICMLPFIRAMLKPTDNSIVDVMGVSGVGWLFPEAFQTPAVAGFLDVVVTVLGPVVFVLPLAFAFVGRTRLPNLALLLVLCNAMWMVAFSRFDAAMLATVGHSIQYLCIVAYVHGKDALARIGPKQKSAAFHMAGFYFVSVAGGVFLFLIVPILIDLTAGLAGIVVKHAEVSLMVAVAINLHHFIVDGYIWRSPRRPALAPSAAPA
jgi:hypothetical protein